MIELLHIDCMEYMATLQDKAFDLAICDPPYGIRQDGHRKNNRSKLAISKAYHKALWDQDAPTEEYFSELFRVSKNQIIWGANNYPQYLQKSSCWIVWDKLNGPNNFADCELAYTSFETAVRKFTFRWSGMLQGNMSVKEIRVHPTQKPVALYRWLLHNYAQPGNRILDTHLGSGSSAIAAHNMGFDFVGCEIDEVYFKAAQKRFKEQTAQTSIF